jgi:ABC-type sugar transport system ATPase subunit
VSDLLLDIKGLSKRFPGVQALSRVDLDVRKGEIHGLIGENGAGKSTLIKAIAGAHIKDAGEMTFDGKPFAPQKPTDALGIGIAIVYQELSLCENMSVAENIFINRHPVRTAFRIIDQQLLRELTNQALTEFGLEISHAERVSALSLAVQEQIEILRALSYSPQLLILDEPTGPLSRPLVERLFELMRSIVDRGVSILYISHNMGEVLEICDRVTVLRDGERVGQVGAADATEQQLAKMMVGRDLGQMYPDRGRVPPGDVVLQVEHLSRPAVFQDVSFQLRRGEILGVAGLIGAGRTDVAMTIFGALSKSGGAIYVDGKEVEIGSPRDAIHEGIAYLPEDRKSLGLFLDFSIAENLLSIRTREFSRAGIVDTKALETASERAMEELQIRAQGTGQIVQYLSGGNQQKTLFAKWVSLNPKVLIIDEPTRGIDVGAKQAIHRMLRDMANEGIGVIMVSSELPEVLGMSDRIMIMDRGLVVDIVDNDESVTEESIMQAIVQFKRGGRNIDTE